MGNVLASISVSDAGDPNTTTGKDAQGNDRSDENAVTVESKYEAKYKDDEDDDDEEEEEEEPLPARAGSFKGYLKRGDSLAVLHATHHAPNHPQAAQHHDLEHPDEFHVGDDPLAAKRGSFKGYLQRGDSLAVLAETHHAPNHPQQAQHDHPDHFRPGVNKDAPPAGKFQGYIGQGDSIQVLHRTHHAPNHPQKASDYHPEQFQVNHDWAKDGNSSAGNIPSSASGPLGILAEDEYNDSD